MPAIGMDLGGTKLSAALVSEYKVVSETRTVPTPHGADNIVAALVQLIDSFKNEATVAGVGIATAGVVDTTTGDIIGSTGNLPGWEGTPLKKIIESKTLLPVQVENDANAAAYADCQSMNLGSATCVVGVTLGTGIGCGIVMNGKVYRGAHYVGEGGHMRIALDNKRLCTCGLWDCWEAYGAGRGLVATAREVLQTAKPEQTELARDLSALTTKAIEQAARDGDMAAQKAMRIYHEHVSVGLANLAHILDPDCFIISGGMSNLVDFEQLTELTIDRCMPNTGGKLKLYKSQLGNAAGVIGAAHLVINELA